MIPPPTTTTTTPHPPSSLDICVHSPTHLIKRPELAILTGLFIKPQTQRGKMEPDLNQNWRKWFPGNVSLALLRYERVPQIFVLLFWFCCAYSLLKQMLQLRHDEALSCCSEVCLNCFNLIGGQHLPAAVTLCTQNIKPPFDRPDKQLCACQHPRAEHCPSTSPLQPPHICNSFSHDTVYEMVCSSC